jgi:hypothetical protein
MSRDKNSHPRLAHQPADYQKLGIDPVKVAQFEGGQRNRRRALLRQAEREPEGTSRTADYHQSHAAGDRFDGCGKGSISPI